MSRRRRRRYPADKDQFIADYKKQMDGFIADLKKLEADVDAGNTADASRCSTSCRGTSAKDKKFNADNHGRAGPVGRGGPGGWGGPGGPPPPPQ